MMLRTRSCYLQQVLRALHNSRPQLVDYAGVGEAGATHYSAPAPSSSGHKVKADLECWEISRHSFSSLAESSGSEPAASAHSEVSTSEAIGDGKPEEGSNSFAVGGGSLKVDKVLELLRSQPVAPRGVRTPPHRRPRANPAYQRSKYIAAVSNLVALLEGAETQGDVERILNDKAVELLGPSEWPWLPLFDALQKGPKPHLVIQVFDWRRSQLDKAPDAKEYSKMISCAGKLNQLDIAEKLFSELKKHGIKYTAVTYNSLIFAYGKNNQPEKALDLFKQMKESDDCQPTLITYNTLISMYSRLSVTDEMEKVFQACQAAGFSPDRHTYNALIWGFMRAAQYGKMEAAFRELEASECRPDAISFNALFIGYSRMEALDKLEETFKAMQKAGIPVNAMVGELMIEAYGRKLDYPKMEGMIKIMDDTPAVTYGSRIFSLLVEAYAAGGRLDDMERSVDRMLLARRLFASPKTLEAVITAFSNAGEYDRLQKTLDRVKISGWMMSSITYNTLLFEYGRGGLLGKMEQAYEAMKDAGVELSPKTFQIMYDAFDKVRDGRGLERTRQRMLQAGFDPSADLDLQVHRAYSDEEIFGGWLRPTRPTR